MLWEGEPFPPVVVVAEAPVEFAFEGYRLRCRDQRDEVDLEGVADLHIGDTGLWVGGESDLEVSVATEDVDGMWGVGFGSRVLEGGG